MTTRTWLITGVSSGFGHALTTQLLERGDRVIGTVRSLDKVTDLRKRYPDTFQVEGARRHRHHRGPRAWSTRPSPAGRVDVVVSNAGYGLFGAAEELTDAQVDHIIATNLTGSITLIRAALPHLRAQGGGRVIQLSSYGGQVAFPGNSLYHATKWGIEGFVESVAQEVAPLRHRHDDRRTRRCAHRVPLRQRPRSPTSSPIYDATPAHAFRAMLDPANGLAPGDPRVWPPRIIESVEVEPAPLRMILGSQALATTMKVLTERLAAFEAQADVAASTDYPNRGVADAPRASWPALPCAAAATPTASRTAP